MIYTPLKMRLELSILSVKLPELAKPKFSVTRLVPATSRRVLNHPQLFSQGGYWPHAVRQEREEVGEIGTRLDTRINNFPSGPYINTI